MDTTSHHAGTSFSLALSCSSASSVNNGSPATALITTSSSKESEEEHPLGLNSVFIFRLENEEKVSPKQSANFLNNNRMGLHCEVDPKFPLSARSSKLDRTSVCPSSNPPESRIEMPVADLGALIADEGSACDQKTEVMLLPSQNSKNNEPNFGFGQVPRTCDLAAVVPNPLHCEMMEPESSVVNNSGIKRPRNYQYNSSSKLRQVGGWREGAMGTFGHCFPHGGRQRCQIWGCHERVNGRSLLCKVHGGGCRRKFLGCTRNVEGLRDFFTAQDCSQRCSQEACTRTARKPDLCIHHGSRKSCHTENCMRSAEDLCGLCISHGTGCHCKALRYDEKAEGSTMFCKTNGSGSCFFPGCTNGKNGSTTFCKGHGGSKNCACQGSAAPDGRVHGGSLIAMLATGL